MIKQYMNNTKKRKLAKMEICEKERDKGEKTAVRERRSRGERKGILNQ